MSLIVDIVSKSLSILVLITLILIVALSLYILFKKTLKVSIKQVDKLLRFFKDNALFLAFIVALTSTLGSLFFSEIAGIDPCKLCWFQRALMYPQSIILASALYFRKKDFAYYSIPLSVVGILISVYQNIGMLSAHSAVTVCSINEPSCFVNYFTIFGFINIPIMAFTGFMTIILLSVLSLKKSV